MMEDERLMELGIMVELECILLTFKFLFAIKLVYVPGFVVCIVLFPKVFKEMCVHMSGFCEFRLFVSFCDFYSYYYVIFVFGVLLFEIESYMPLDFFYLEVILLISGFSTMILGYSSISSVIISYHPFFDPADFWL